MIDLTRDLSQQHADLKTISGKWPSSQPYRYSLLAQSHLQRI